MYAPHHIFLKRNFKILILCLIGEKYYVFLVPMQQLTKFFKALLHRRIEAFFLENK